MTDFYKYDVIVVKFPFASSLKHKARPAVIISSDLYNKTSRETLIILVISSRLENKLDIEPIIKDWKETNLLKPSIFKSSVPTIEKSFIIAKLDSLSNHDRKNLDKLMSVIC